MIKYRDTCHYFAMLHDVGLRAFGAQAVLVACLFLATLVALHFNPVIDMVGW